MRSLLSLNKYFWKYRLRFFSGIFFITASAIFGLLPVDLVGDSVDYAAEHFRKHDLGTAAVTGQLLWNGFVIIGFTLISGFFMFLNRQTIIVMSRLIEYDQKNDIYAHYQQLDQAFYKRNNTGDLMNRISEDVSRVRMYTGPAIMYTLNTIIALVATIIFMWHKDHRLTLYVLAPLPMLTISIYYVSNLINKKSLKVQAQLSRLSTMAQEGFSGIRVIKAFAYEDKQQERFSDEAEKYRSLNMGLARTEAMFQPFMLLLIGLSTILAIFIGGSEVIDGRLSAGIISGFIVYVLKLTWPIASLGWVTSLVQRAAASQERINEFLLQKPAIENPTIEPLHLKGKIEFRNVSFTYEDTGIQALQDISFTVNPGQSMALIGRTGSGKSTVAALINRLYDTTGGQILIDGKDIRSVNLDELRHGTGFVPQEVFLFSDTIEGNIAFSYTSASDNGHHREAVEQAARDAAIYSNIMEFPKAFETVVGERGITLSGGQKQRISIARAIIRHPQILVFDDCLSAVDTETEEEILTNLRRIMEGKTTIIISHRVSSVQYADQILVMDHGRIIEHGNHQELMLKKGTYYELFQKQIEELQEKA